MIFSLLMTSSTTFAQEENDFENTKDSLLQIVNRTQLKNQVKPLVSLFNHIYPRDDKLMDSILFILKGIEETYPSHEDMADIWLVEAGIHNYRTNFDSLKVLSQKVLEYSPISSYHRGRAFNNLGIYEERSGSLDSALMYYNKSLAADDYESYKLYNNMGRLYSRKNNSGEAIKCYEKAMNVAKSEGFLNAEAVIANNIGTAYEQIDNLDKAIVYYKRSLSVKKQINDERGQIYALYNLALVSPDIEESRSYTREGLIIAEKFKHDFFIDHFKTNLASLLLDEGHVEEAENILLPIYVKAKNDSTSYNMTIEMVLAQLYISIGQYDKAEKYLDDFKAYAESINAQAEIQNVRINYLEIYAAQKNYKKYYEVASQYYPLEDSLKSEKSIKKFITLEDQLDEEQKEKVELLNQSIIEKEKSRLRLGLISLLVGAILMLLLYLRNRRVKYQSVLLEKEKEISKSVEALNVKLKELDVTKTNFFTNITHELRTPLTLIIGPLEKLRTNTKDPENLTLINMTLRNARRQLVLVNQLLDISKVDAGKMDIKMSKINIVPFIREICNAYKSYATIRNIDLEFKDTIEVPDFYYDHEKMTKIFYNVLSNAFKFSSDYSNISIEIETSDKEVSIFIKDEGQGIPLDRIDRIFDRFYQIDNAVDNKMHSTGVGLSLTKELVELQGGNISIDSEQGKGTIVRLDLLLGESHLEERDIVPAVNNSSIDISSDYLNIYENEVSETSASQEVSKDKSTILVVEDNTDVRSFIVNILQASFNVITATNGEEGFERALEASPNLIISDVMMPIKNGFELCTDIKKDINTSHIPVILLTAKATHDEKLEGLETGADAYIFKPFDPKEILIQSKNLITSRNLLRAKFASAVTLKPSEVTTNSIDKVFLEHVIQVIEDNMSNENFGVNDLAAFVNMSRANINKKLSALVGKSSNKLIQSIRLQRARDLLAQKAGTVSEIAFRVGFSSPSYFAKCFKDMFELKPGEMTK